MGKGGKAKGSAASPPVQKPWLKKAAAFAAPPVSKGKGASKSAPASVSSKGASKGKGAAKASSGPPAKGGGKSGEWVFIPASAPKGKGKDKDRGKGKDKGKGKDEGKGKGKGKKGKRAAPLNSKFWEAKLEDEGREELGDKVYSGVVQRYMFKNGWGFIAADNPASLPKKVKAKLAEQKASAEEAGKKVDDANLLYFRKPDVNHTEGFKLMEDVPVTFSLYVDEKGAGAYNVSQA